MVEFLSPGLQAGAGGHSAEGRGHSAASREHGRLQTMNFRYG